MPSQGRWTKFGVFQSHGGTPSHCASYWLLSMGNPMVLGYLRIVNVHLEVKPYLQTQRSAAPCQLHSPRSLQGVRNLRVARAPTPTFAQKIGPRSPIARQGKFRTGFEVTWLWSMIHQWSSSDLAAMIYQIHSSPKWKRMERCKCPAPATDMAIGHLVRKPNLVALKLRAMEFADKKLPLDVAIAAVTKTSLHFFALFCIGGSQGISPNPVFFS